MHEGSHLAVCHRLMRRVVARKGKAWDEAATSESLLSV